MPRLSVFLPNYNHGRHIGRAIEAIASQSRPPDELVIVDDGSTDNSVSVIWQYAERYSWIRLVTNSNNRGVLKVLDECLPLLRGDYVFFASADDRILPGFFEAGLAAAARQPNAGMVFGQIVAETDREEALYTIKVRAWDTDVCAEPERFRRECLEAEPAGQSLVGSTLFRRQALAEVGGFRVELGSWCDSFAWRAVGLRYGVCYLPFPCMAWTIHAGSISHAASRRPRHMFDIVRRGTALMHSPEFRDDFPPEHVRRWQRGYYLIIIEHYVLSYLPQTWLTRMSRNRFFRYLRTTVVSVFS